MKFTSFEFFDESPQRTYWKKFPKKFPAEAIVGKICSWPWESWPFPEALESSLSWGLFRSLSWWAWAVLSEQNIVQVQCVFSIVLRKDLFKEKEHLNFFSVLPSASCTKSQSKTIYGIDYTINSSSRTGYLLVRVNAEFPAPTNIVCGIWW